MKYILKIIFIGSILMVKYGPIKAQQTGKVVIFKDSSIMDTAVPAPLLKISKKYNTSAISTVNGTDLYNTPTSNLTNTLIGRLPGLYAKQSTGEPLGIPEMVGTSNMMIRGTGSYGFVGNNTYKVYIDGFESNLNAFVSLPAAAIESVSILKDAAALATFGMKGANGVLWVVTKKGQAGKTTVQFQIRSGNQRPINIDKPLGSYDYARLYNQAISNDNGNVWSPKYSAAQLADYKSGAGTNTDWYQQGLKRSAPFNNADLTLYGGNDAAKFNINLDYMNQQGLFNIPNNDMTSNENLQRYDLSSNLNLQFLQIFEANIDLRAMIENQKAPNYSTNSLWDDMGAYPSNIYPVMADSAKWSGTALFPNNPIASGKALGWVNSQYRILKANFSLKEKLDFITSGLYLKEAYSFYSYASTHYSKTANYARYFDGATTTVDQNTPIKAQPQTPAGQEDLKQASITLGYDHNFRQSHLNAAIDYYGSNYLGDGLIFYATNYQNISGKVNYNYKNKYIGEFGFSYFGSDAYAPGSRWGFYPAVSAAWVISNEQFMRTSTLFNLLKLRASVGKMGGLNDNIFQNGRYLYQQYYQGASLGGGSFYMNNGGPTAAPILAPLYTANPNAFAEQSLKYNVGIDLKLFDRLSINTDVFLDKRSGILTQDNSIPDYYGYNNLANNVGKVTSSGMDLAASFADKIGAFNYSINAMASYNKNKIDYMAETMPAYHYNGATGRAIGTPLGLLATGYYQLSDFNADASLKQGEPVPAFGAVQPGDLKYKDLNNDGKIDQTDVTAIGTTPYPKWVYSFGGQLNYKGIDFSIFFNGAQGADVNILNAANMQTEAFVNNGNSFPIANGAWAYYPEQGIDTRATATYPRLTTVANNNNYRTSSFWIKHADYLRIHNIELGYTFPKLTSKKLNISVLRVYANAVNLVTWSSLLSDYNMDPETIAGYPALKSFNVGISATF